MRKIMILNGSPRAKGNTAELIESFTKGAESAGHQVVCFDLQKMNIHGCLAAAAEERISIRPVFRKTICLKSIPYTANATLLCLPHRCTIGA